MKSPRVILLAFALLFTAINVNATAYSKVAAPPPGAVQSTTFTDGKMLINTPFKGTQQVTVADHNGTQLGSFKVTAKRGAVTIPAVASTGDPVIYQITIKAADGKLLVKKVLVF